MVTGAARGLGATFARALSVEGAKVMVCDILDPQRTVDAIQAAGGDASGMIVDVTEARHVTEVVEQTLATYGRIDILVNNAAVSASLELSPFDQISLDEWDRVMRVNVRGALQCIAAVAPAMREQSSGKIINITSGTVFKGSRHMCHYVASKAAVLGMTRALAEELGDHHICVNVIAPGITATDAFVGTPGWNLMNASVKATRAFKREEQPEDLIGALIFLSSTDSDFMTGQCMVVDGGSIYH